MFIILLLFSFFSHAQDGPVFHCVDRTHSSSISDLFIYQESTNNYFIEIYNQEQFQVEGIEDVKRTIHLRRFYKFHNEKITVRFSKLPTRKALQAYVSIPQYEIKSHLWLCKNVRF